MRLDMSFRRFSIILPSLTLNVSLEDVILNSFPIYRDLASMISEFHLVPNILQFYGFIHLFIQHAFTEGYYTVAATSGHVGNTSEDH